MVAVQPVTQIVVAMVFGVTVGLTAPGVQAASCSTSSGAPSGRAGQGRAGVLGGAGAAAVGPQATIARRAAGASPPGGKRVMRVSRRRGGQGPGPTPRTRRGGRRSRGPPTGRDQPP